MKFCEKCNLMVQYDRCPACGSKKVRDIRENDFVLLVNLDSFHCEMLEYALNDNQIENACIPYYPLGVTNANAGRASGRRVYVRFKDLERAMEVYKTIFFSSSDDVAKTDD